MPSSASPSPRLRRLCILAAVILLLGLVCRFIAYPTVVAEDSMEPTLKSWEACLLLRCWHYQPHRGDIVIFRTANDPPLCFVKRVIALPGETIAIAHGQVTINGTVLPEPYTSPNSDWTLAPTNVPPNRIYVIGDNRAVPIDTVVQGIVATRLVTARVVWHGRWHQ